MSKPRYIAVDFDGTCVTHEWPLVGRDIGAQPVLKELVAAGYKLILWTMRSDETLRDAVKWFEKNEIPLYGIQENPSQVTWTKSPKCYAHVYIDDTALGAPLIQNGDPNIERPYIDWTAVRKFFFK